MNRIAFYVLLILCYLGLSKSFSPTELGVSFINNAEEIGEIVQGYPLTVVLTDMHSTGFIIKTHYHKYKVIYGFRGAEEIVVRASKKFTIKNKHNLGMSIFRRNSKVSIDNTTPLPPGSIFVGDPAFGRWKKKNWHFHRTYRYLPKLLGWDSFKANKQFYLTVQDHIGQNKTFFGLNKEFGTAGKITKAQFPEYFDELRVKNVSFKQLIVDYLRNNFLH
jgi:hypothetical protein